MRLIFICGIHCSGKTTLLKNLKENSNITFYGNEIGKDLFYQRKFQPDEQNIKFELEVTTKELERDKRILDEYTGSVAVESWHPGNLAYAYTRNPDCAEKIIDLVKKSPLLSSAHGIWLKIPPETIEDRSKTFINNTKWAVQFYKKINENIENSLKVLNLFDRTITINATKPLPEIVKSTQQYIQKLENI